MERSPGLASEWILAAAERGYPPAQFVLGKMYSEGEGLVANTVEAIAWISKAAEQDFEEAKTWLAENDSGHTVPYK